EALPQPVNRYVAEASAALGCDPGYVAPHVLPVLGGLLGNHYRLALKRSWLEPPVVWAVTVGESGTLKSPAWQLATFPLYSLQRELMKEYRKKRERYEQEMVTYRSRENEDPPPVKPVEPVEVRVVVSDITVEKLGAILQENPQGLLAARDELSGW